MNLLEEGCDGGLFNISGYNWPAGIIWTDGFRFQTSTRTGSVVCACTSTRYAFESKTFTQPIPIYNERLAFWKRIREGKIFSYVRGGLTCVFFCFNSLAASTAVVRPVSLRPPLLLLVRLTSCAPLCAALPSSTTAVSVLAVVSPLLS